jgi:hypothetical protein
MERGENELISKEKTTGLPDLTAVPLARASAAVSEAIGRAAGAEPGVCPSCKERTMFPPPRTQLNALSRKTDRMVCQLCGVREAMADARATREAADGVVLAVCRVLVSVWGEAAAASRANAQDLGLTEYEEIALRCVADAGGVASLKDIGEALPDRRSCGVPVHRGRVVCNRLGQRGLLQVHTVGNSGQSALLRRITKRGREALALSQQPEVRRRRPGATTGGMRSGSLRILELCAARPDRAFSLDELECTVSESVAGTTSARQRVSVACTALTGAGLLTIPVPGSRRITELGLGRLVEIKAGRRTTRRCDGGKECFVRRRCLM